MGIKYEYGGVSHNWYSSEKYDTVEEAIAGCVASRTKQIMRGYAPDRNVCIWQIEHSRTTDEFGLLEYTTRTRRVMMVDDELVEKIDFIDVVTKRFKKVMSWCTVTKDDIHDIRVYIRNVYNFGYLTESDVKLLYAMIDEKPIRRIVSGDFAEGHTVQVNIDGRMVDRKVKYSKDAGDLYVVMDNKRYFLCEFE